MLTNTGDIICSRAAARGGGGAHLMRRWDEKPPASMPPGSFSRGRRG